MDLPQLQFVGVVGEIALVASWRDPRHLAHPHLGAARPAVLAVGVPVRLMVAVPAGHFPLALDEAAGLVLGRCHEIDLLDRGSQLLEEIGTETLRG